MRPKICLALFALLSLAPIASAHPGHDHTGFTAGAAHPLSGLDHLLAMIAIGIWAARIGGRAIWMLPATFVCAMLAGGVLSSVGVALPAVESTIAASVLVLGIALAIRVKPPLWIAMTVAALFAIFHGYAHMTELAAGHSAARYAAGFLISTITLHAIGLSLGMFAMRVGNVRLTRVAGAAIAICGIALCLGVF